MICRTPDQAFQAGYDEPCVHQVPNPSDCPDCRLTDDEIARLAVLNRPYVVPVDRQAA